MRRSLRENRSVNNLYRRYFQEVFDQDSGFSAVAGAEFDKVKSVRAVRKCLKYRVGLFREYAVFRPSQIVFRSFIISINSREPSSS